ncbi:hypothetical protein EYF80_058946 [Liparis tanakae]|uniref:Uncharacterized protein n=1 Tax=Liparis tanakae TaxID=230148 RepID=A0A4Z2ERI0_9TELE|nr:hypothetical protein EYF80_058946 [Liparis tanakae]
MSERGATHVLFRAAAPNCINWQQLSKLPESFLRGGSAWRRVPVRLELAEALKPEGMRKPCWAAAAARVRWSGGKTGIISGGSWPWTC